MNPVAIGMSFRAAASVGKTGMGELLKLMRSVLCTNLSPYSMRQIIFHNPLSPGDVVVSTAAIRDLHAAHPGKFLTGYKGTARELLKFNPHISPLNERDEGVEVIRMEYPLIHSSNEIPGHFLEGYTRWMTEHLGVPVPLTAFKGDIHLSDEEKGWTNQIHSLTGMDIPFWILNAGGKYDFTNKWWAQERFQAVVHQLAGKVLFVQVGEKHHHHPALTGVIDLRGKTDLRQFTRLMYHADGVLCPVTFAMHLAAAVETRPDRPDFRPCVVIAGGREPAHWERYPHHRYIDRVGTMTCCLHGGCWKSRLVPIADGDAEKNASLCEEPHGDLPGCMDMISVEDVVLEIEFYFRGGICAPLTTDQWNTARGHLTR